MPGGRSLPAGPGGEFRPPPGLGNAHVQSILASLKLRQGLMRSRTRGLTSGEADTIVDSGDGVRLLAQVTPAAGTRRRLAVLIHGWEGSSRSVYLLSAAATLHAAGYAVVRLNLRDHGDSHHLNRELFHSCRIGEVVGAVRAIARRYADHDLYLGGFSLGGNFALRVAARANGEGLVIKRIAAVCPVIDPARTLDALEQGWPVYRRYFMAKWRRSLARKAACHPGHYEFGDLRRFRTLTEMTAFFVDGYTEYPDMDTYLAGYAVTGDVLASIEAPAHLLATADDPVIPVADLERVARPAALRVEVSARGGHCGFVLGARGPSWADLRMLAHFEASAS